MKNARKSLRDNPKYDFQCLGPSLKRKRKGYSIKSLFKNEATRKILLFFNENPHCIDTVKGISLWIGWDINSMQKALNQLVKKGIIISHQTASTTAYAYTNNKEVVKKIEKYIKNMLK